MVSKYKPFTVKFLIFAQAGEASNTSVKAQIVSAHLIDDHGNEVAVQNP
jgi:hypothetical protein